MFCSPGTDTSTVKLKAWNDFLLEMGEGRFPTVPNTTDYVVLPPSILSRSKKVKKLIKWVYGNIADWRGDERRMVKRGIVTPKNLNVDAMNEICTNAYPGEVGQHLAHLSSFNITSIT